MKKVEIHPDAVERVKKFTINDPQLGFGKYVAPIMIQALYDHGEWQRFDLLPYGPLQLDPCSKVLHYGQEIFEGMKVFRHPDDSIHMFRPEMNARRFNLSARRMAMPEIPEEDYLNACATISAYCKHLIPKRLGESLYLRPFMIATEVGLGIKPSKQFLFIIVASPSGSYFAGDAVKVYIERDDIRCAPGGIGFAKTGGNYAASLNSYAKTIQLGCDQTMWLDSVEHKYIEEMSGMNFFAVIDNKVVTPTLTDTILDGVTRKSIIDIARAEKIEVEERKLSIDEVLKAVQEGRCTEAFVCGTAAVVAPIASFMDKDQSVYKLRDSQGKIGMQLREKLIAIQAGRFDAPQGWTYPVRDLNF
ncbi:branched-chain amino acid aminotransferase [Peredibacter sp. HCB2-198]|uniref:branched-chain amino acid aminotransferase n=1 Tax=Peredibacter sp. HCB2-198 TaxID=3383025 RepID=UPI0038B64845